jgi:hypothetical protein
LTHLSPKPALEEARFLTASLRLLGFGRVLLLGGLVVGLIGLFRLGRQFPSAMATPALLVPFLKPVLALALEAGALAALSAALLALLGARATASLSERARAGLPLVAVFLGVLGVAAVLPRGTERPGALANDLIARARGGCDGGASTVAVAVPLLGLDVRCAEPRRIVGPMPGVAAVELGMRELTFSDDLRRVSIVGLELTAKRALGVHLTAGSAQIAGLAPWTRSPQLSTRERLLMLGGLGALLWLAASVWWRLASPPLPPGAAPQAPWRAWLERLWRALLLSSPGAAAAGVVISLDQRRAGLASYAVAAASGLLLLGALRLVAQRAPKLFGSFGDS